MLIGEYTHALDAKNRLSLPAKFRKELGKKVIVTNGLDACLFLYSEREWAAISEKIAALPLGQTDTRGFSRFMLSGAVEADVDAAGRILIPDFLKRFGRLKNRVVLTGVMRRVEIWDEAAWRAYKRRIERGADRMAERLGEIGAV